MRYSYPCEVALDDEEAESTGREAYVATFPDVPPAITGGWSVQEVNGHLRDCLETALSFSIDSNEPLPEPSDPEPGQVLVAVSAPVAAQLALYEVMRAEGITPTEVARRIGMRPAHARRLTDIYRPAKSDEVERALAALGLQIVSEAIPLEQWAPSLEAAPVI